MHAIQIQGKSWHHPPNATSVMHGKIYPCVSYTVGKVGTFVNCILYFGYLTLDWDTIHVCHCYNVKPLQVYVTHCTSQDLYHTVNVTRFPTISVLWNNDSLCRQLVHKNLVLCCCLKWNNSVDPIMNLWFVENDLGVILFVRVVVKELRFPSARDFLSVLI